MYNPFTIRALSDIRKITEVNSLIHPALIQDHIHIFFFSRTLLARDAYIIFLNLF